MIPESGPLLRRVLLVNDGVLFVARPDGTIRDDLEGLYFDDERRLDGLQILLDDEPLSPLRSSSPDYRTLEVWALSGGEAEVLRELIRVRYELSPEGLQIGLERVGGLGTRDSMLSVRFEEAATDIFAVRGLPHGTALPPDHTTADVEPTPALDVEVTGGERTQSGMIEFRPGASGHILVRTNTTRDGHSEPGCRFTCTAASVEEVWRASMDDLAALRMRDRELHDAQYLAGGAPWYLTLFGRDSLVAGIEASLVVPDLLLGALTALSERQGRRHDERSGEAPGKILHELRRGSFVRSARGWGSRYYGSVDSTPLFLIALGNAWRRGCSTDAIAGLLPNAERAADYLTASRDVGSDGLLYYRHGALGLANQGWKDSPDSVQFRDGRVPTGDVALVEVQGYVVAALRELARLRRGLGTDDGADLDARAGHLAERLKSFWMDDERTFAQALTRSGEVVDAVTSNPGHLLWAGVLAGDEASKLAERLLEPDLMSGFGLRTLATTQAGFDPFSYHCGSVWPHDSAMAAVGMLRYHLEGGERLAWALLDAATTLRGRLPELVVGLSREATGVALPGPTACTPQAWASAAPIALLQSLIGLEFDVPNGSVRLRPRLPREMGLELSDVPVAHGRISLRVRGRVVESCEATDLDIDIATDGAG